MLPLPFLNEALFNQPKYDEEIIKWLIDHNYDIGNHTKGHIDFGKVNKDIAQSSIAYIYQKLDQIILNKYVNIIALLLVLLIEKIILFFHIF